jgi:hypothetical protein
MDLTCSSRGLLNLPQSKYPVDFEFVLPTASFPCSSVVACFLSPLVARLQSADSTVSQLILPIENTALFEKVLALATGSEIRLTPDAYCDFAEISKALENVEFLSMVFENIEPELSEATVLSRLKKKQICGLDYEEEVEFCAKNIAALEASLLLLDEVVIGAIVSDSGLILPDEDFLIRFLTDYVQKHSAGYELFEYVHFDHATSKAIEVFMEALGETEDFFSHMTMVMWGSICSRLKCTVPEERGRVSCLYHQDKPLDGIIAYLTRECRGNVHDKEVITVIADGPYNTEPSNAPKNVADVHADTEFFSANLPNQWIGYDFHPWMRILFTAYSIRTYYSGGAGGHNLKSWVIEVSQDRKNWEVVDSHVNENLLNDANIVKAFTLTQPVECRAIRLRQTGPNHKGSHSILISGLEVFGDLIFQSPREFRLRFPPV